MELKCPRCCKAQELSDAMIGVEVQCPFCGETFIGEKESVLQLGDAHTASLDAKMRQGGEGTICSNELVTDPMLQVLVREGVIATSTAYAVEVGLTTANTELSKEDLDSLRSVAALKMDGEDAETVRRALADLAIRTAAHKIDISDPADCDRAVEASVRGAFAEENEESEKCADAVIAMHEHALKLKGKAMSEAEKAHYRRCAAIQMYYEKQRNNSCTVDSGDFSKMGGVLLRIRKTLEGRKLSSVQQDKIESYKADIQAVKTKDALLPVLIKFDEYIRNEVVDYE